MEIFPAIDLRDGKAVRLTQGDFDRMDVYSGDPLSVAHGFREAGAKNLHLVDLDGARSGSPRNREVIRGIVSGSGLFVEVGGGIRDERTVAEYLNLGVGRVILGSAAIESFEFTADMVRRYGGKIAVGVDARDGKVAVHGWENVTETDALAFCKRLCDAGVQTVIYTDIARDGAMRGTNLEAYRELVREISCHIIASGGISALEEISALAQIGVHGAILGKALYTGALSLKGVMALC